MSNSGKGGGDLPLPVVIGVLVVVVLIVGGVAWHYVFQAPSNPLDGKTSAEKIKIYQDNAKKHPQKGNPFAAEDAKPAPK